MIAFTGWYVSMTLLAAAAVTQVTLLMHYSTRSGREVARFLDAIAFDDTSASFTALSRDSSFADLGAAMMRVLDQLRLGRAEREEQAQYMQTMIAHVPVALISVDERGAVQLLNLAARRLFENSCSPDGAVSPVMEKLFAAGMNALLPGNSAIVRDGTRHAARCSSGRLLPPT